MKLHLSDNSMRHVGVRKCRYSVVGGWSDAVLIDARWFSIAISYGKADRMAYPNGK